jgi:hypothetical protein
MCIAVHLLGVQALALALVLAMLLTSHTTARPAEKPKEPYMSRVQHRSGQVPHRVSRLGGETEIVQELSVMLDEEVAHRFRADGGAEGTARPPTKTKLRSIH